MKTGADMKATADRCTHCGSRRTQEARRSIDAVTFRCLHCWKTSRGPRRLNRSYRPTTQRNRRAIARDRSSGVSGQKNHGNTRDAEFIRAPTNYPP